MPAQFRLLESGDRRLLESGDDRLLESSTVDQSVALPLIDGSQVFGPGVAAAGSILLPLIDDGATLPPLVFEDKQIDVPLVDGGQVFGPSVSGSIDLPLVDGGQLFGPTVTVEQTAALPLIDEGVTFAPSFTQPQTLDLRFLDGGWPFGPVVTGQVLAGLAVYLVVDDGDDILLEPVTVPTFRDPIDDIGSFTVTLANDDPTLPACDFDAVLRFEVDGLPVFSGVIEDREIVHLAAGEEHDHVTALTGPGFLGIASRDVVYPSRGVESLPIEDVRSFAWPSPDFDASMWGFAKKINRQREYASWRTPLPWIWPDTTGWWIWGDVPTATHTFAPTGVCLFRKEFTLDSEVTARIFVAFDFAGRLYLDGAEVTAFNSFTVGRYIEVPLSAGTHVLAARVSNEPKPTLPNPGGFILAAYEVGDSGLLGDLITHTDHTWRCLPYPNRAPGFTPGQVLYILRDETDIFDGVTFDFTATLDSAGEPWSSYPEITVDVGRSHLEMLRQMAAAGFIDVAAAPGAPVIRAWNYSTRGVIRTTTLTQTVGNPDASEFRALRHKGHRARLNKALIRTAEGWTEQVDADSMTAHGTRGGHLALGHVQSHGKGQDIAETIMERRAVPAYSTTARLLPSADGTTPYKAFENGDHVTCLDETGALLSQRVRAITLDPDEVGVLEWGVELREIELEQEELHQNALRRAADGHLIAGARVSSPAGAPPLTDQQVTAIDVAEFSMHTFDGNLPTGLGIARRAVKSGNVVEITVTLTADSATTTATTVRVYLNGSVLGTLITVPAGADEAEIPVARVAVRANLDRLRPELVSVASQVEGVDITVRAI